MKKIQSLQRRNAVFGAAVVLLLALLLLRPSETSIVRATDLPLAFPKLESQIPSARSVVLERLPAPKTAPKPGETKKEDAKAAESGPTRLELAKRAEVWVLASAFDHPTREGAVQRLLDGIARARVRGAVTSRADTFGSYADDKGWIRVEAKDQAGLALASFSVGKTASWPDVYLLLDEGAPTARVVRATGFERDVASLSTEDWIEALVWPGLSSEEVTRIDVEQRRDQRTLTFERQAVKKEPPKPPAGQPEAEEPPTPAETTWAMTAPKAGEAIRGDVDGLVRSFTGLRAKDVVAAATNEETETKYGLKDPELVLKATLKAEKPGSPPVTHVLQVGKKSDDGKDWYVRREGQSWVYVVAGYSIDPFRKDPDSFLVKKDEPKKEEGTKPEGVKDEGKPAEAPPGEVKPHEGPKPEGQKPEEGKPEDGKKDEPKKDEPPKDGTAAEGSPDGR